ncbi:hypothetical protein BH11BAC2_BH11BAC2_18210 [soil metagenome]
MPTVYRFRVSFEDYDDVSRDIEIKSTSTFEDLHVIIQSSIGFDASKPASFFMSTDLWLKGQEISSEPKVGKDGEKIPLMKNSRLADFIADPHQKIYYQSDYDANWTFYVELFKILPAADPMRNYPVCVRTGGEAPKQYKVIAVPKIVLSEEDELDKLLSGSAIAEVTLELDPEEELDEVDNLMAEAEEGVDEDEIKDMGEEGEEDEMSEEGEEMGLSDEDQKEDY